MLNTPLAQEKIVNSKLTQPVYIWIKLIFDYLLTLGGLVVVLPLLWIIGICVFCSNPGSVIYKHKRVGKNGKPFYCYKFRTMGNNAQAELERILEENPLAQAEWEISYKLKDDPRVTRIGGFLRRTSLDELPQVFNVLKGEMSLVGPRPIVRAELEKYGEYQAEYLAVTPGITGYWQVNGRSDTTYEERVQMDLWYIYNWSLWLDIKLLWKTIFKVWSQEGAY